MKTLSIYIGIIGMLLLAVLPARAASEAEFRKLSKTYTLRADGSQEMRVQKELTLFTHAAMNGLYGETFIVYNPDFQKLEKPPPPPNWLKSKPSNGFPPAPP